MENKPVSELPGQLDKGPESGSPKKAVEQKYHYCVLYTDVLKQAEVCSVLKKALPQGRGDVFYPCMECCRRDAGGKLEIRPIFPGYIFIRSDMGRVELHELVRDNRDRVLAFIRELKWGQGNAAGNVVEGTGDTPSGQAGEGTGYVVSDLTEEEAGFMDFLLDIDNPGGSADSGQGTEKCGPQCGLLRMSYGYQEGGRYKVMEGPLRAYEGHIAGVNRHDKKAFLDFKINGKTVRAGFGVMPKRHWFPEDMGAPEVLPDGTEVDLKALAKAMMK